VPAHVFAVDYDSKFISPTDMGLKIGKHFTAGSIVAFTKLARLLQ
jgi:hypothetical protein